MLLGYTKIASKTTPCLQWCSKQKQYKLGFKVNKMFWITLHIAKHYFSTLVQVGFINDEKAVFEQLTLSDFKKWSSTALKTLSNYTIIMTNNSYEIRLSWVWCFIFVAYFWVSSTGCSYEFHGVFKHFQNLENLYVDYYEAKTAYLLPSELLKWHSANSHD